MIICNKSSCNYYKKIFDSKNKLHNYIRSHKCQKLLFNKSDAVIQIVLIKLFISEKNVINDVNIAKKGITRFIITFTFVIKSITSYKFNLSTFVFIESIIFKVTIILSLTSLSIYRFISPLSSIYELYKKSYFTIVDLYMRYALLNKSQVRSKITRIIIVFFIIFIYVETTLTLHCASFYSN